MSSTQKQMFEGVGAPVNVSETNGHIDPTLDSCCQREIESNRKQHAVETALRKHDRVARAEKARRQPLALAAGNGGLYNSYNLINGMSFGSGCRCCYDPNADGGEYDLLAEARNERGNVTATGGVDGNFDDGVNSGNFEEGGADGARNNDDDSGSDGDSDDEFDYLLDEDLPGAASSGRGDYDSLRRAELENAAQHHEAARHHGYGVHRQMHPSRVFASAGYGADSVRDRVRPLGSAVHLYDARSPLSVSLDFCLEGLATRFAGTKFVRGVGVASVPYAEGDGGASGWKKADLPMMLALRDGRVVAYSSGLRDFHRERGDNNGVEVESKAVEQWLDNAGVLIADPPPADSLCRIRPEEEMLLENMRKLNMIGGMGGGAAPPWMCGEIGRTREEDLEEEESKRYDCGVGGCNKCFFHEHVGVQNEAQDGLLVPESQVASSTD